MSTSALTPDRALRRLGDFSTDIRASVLLSPDGSVAAHSLEDDERGAELAGLVRDLVERSDGARPEPVAEIEIGLPGGKILAARRRGFVLGVVASRLAISSVVRYDLDRLLAGLAEPGG